MTQAFALETLEAAIPSIFDQVQLSTANHRKNCTALHKLSLQAATVRHSSKDGRTVKLVGEKLFCNIFLDMTARVLATRKGCVAADRVIKFIGSYIQFALQKGAFPVYIENNVFRLLMNPDFIAAQLNAKKPEDDDADNVPAVRFTSRLLKWLLQGFNAKDKTVRLRVVSLVAEMIGHLDEIECVRPRLESSVVDTCAHSEDMFSALRQNYVSRAFDKEAAIRSYAVIGLSKLVAGDAPSELPADEPSIIEILLDRLQYDESA